MSRRLAILFHALVLFLFSMAHPVVAAPPGDDSRLLKSAYIYNFAKFTRWPTMPDEVYLHLCILGSDALVPTLQLLSGKAIGQRQLQINPIQPSESPATCQMLYVAGSERDNYQQHLSAFSNTSVLVISEIEGFAKGGGMIELSRTGEHIRFRINLAAAKAAGLALSSRLLSLAVVIGEKETE